MISSGTLCLFFIIVAIEGHIRKKEKKIIVANSEHFIRSSFSFTHSLKVKNPLIWNMYIILYVLKNVHQNSSYYCIGYGGAHMHAFTRFAIRVCNIANGITWNILVHSWVGQGRLACTDFTFENTFLIAFNKGYIFHVSISGKWKYLLLLNEIFRLELIYMLTD